LGKRIDALSCIERLIHKENVQENTKENMSKLEGTLSKALYTWVEIWFLTNDGFNITNVGHWKVT
jgi:type IV secretory pathway TrbD component